MHWGVVAALIAVIFAYVLLARHSLGFAIRVTGEAPRAARFGGVNPSRLILFCLGVSGMLAGLAGMFEVAGPAGQITIDFNVGYGFYRNYRSLFRSSSPHWHYACWPIDGLNLYRWRHSSKPTPTSRGSHSGFSKACCCSSFWPLTSSPITVSASDQTRLQHDPQNFHALFMGSAMGLMMLVMAHRQLTSVDTMGFIALGIFVGIHLGVALLALALPILGSHT